MNKQTTVRWWAATLPAALAVLAACGGGDGGPGPEMQATDASAVSTLATASSASALDSQALQPLSVAEAQSLAFMREEERLAQDVYISSALRWPALPIFWNIASSEATHTAAVKALLDRYQLPDPMAGLPTGVFFTPEFQALYDSLVAASSLSLVEALKVGAQIEELDMRDIQAQMTVIDNADILRVYDNLLRGSRNHLRAFMKVLVQLGGSYTPQYISQEQFDSIVTSPMETGG